MPAHPAFSRCSTGPAAAAAAAATASLQSCLTLCDPIDPIRLHRPWDSPGKNTGVGCHILLQCMKVKSESEVAQSPQGLSDPGTAAYQAPPSMGFSRQEYWSRVPLPTPQLALVGPKGPEVPVGNDRTGILKVRSPTYIISITWTQVRNRHSAKSEPLAWGPLPRADGTHLSRLCVQWTSHGKIETDLGGGIYTMEMGKSCKSGLPFPSPASC